METTTTIQIAPQQESVDTELKQSASIVLDDGTKIYKRFTMPGVYEHLMDHRHGLESDTWCSVGCLASKMYGRNCKDNRRKVRRNIPLIFREMLERYGQFAVIKFNGDYGSATALQFYSGSPTQEAKEWAHHKLEKLVGRLKLSDAQYRKACDVIANLVTG